jgi:8-oxo-dGTP pyrophosphatase MutT (NUDIX family)
MTKKPFKLKPLKEYLLNSPKKRVAAAMVILNSKNQLLIVKPTYKDHWSLPGGVVERDESPLDACIRETFEEIGLKLKPKELLLTRYVKKPELENEFIHFLFYAGKIECKKIKYIKLAEDEIEKFKFVNFDQIVKYNKRFSAYIVKYKKQIIKGKNIGYLEAKNEKIS